MRTPRKASSGRRILLIVVSIAAVLSLCLLIGFVALHADKKRSVDLAQSLSGLEDLRVTEKFRNYPFLQGEGAFALEFEVGLERIARVESEWDRAESGSETDRSSHLLEYHRRHLGLLDISYGDVESYYYRKVCLQNASEILKQDYVVLVVHSKTDTTARVGVSTGYSFVRDWESGKGSIVHCPEVNLLQED